MSALKARVEAEVHRILGPVYGDRPGRLDYDKSAGTWVLIRQVDVPRKLTKDGTGASDILILIPPAYPQVPPDGFYCDQGLKIANHYFQGWRDKFYPDRQQELIKQRWNWFCIHVHDKGATSGWRATGDIKRGDNLLTYLRLCQAILEGESRKVI